MEHVNVGADKHKHNGRRWLEKKLGKKTVLLALCVVAALVSSIVSSFRVETVALLQATTTHTSVTTNTSRGVDVDELQLLKPEEQKQEREHEGSSQRHSPDDHHENKKASAAMLSSIAIIESNNTNTTGRCAINLYGLPRGFKNLVLPSVIRNVIGPNLEHECDYFLHYYRITREGKSTTTKGGTIYPDDVFLLEPAVHNAAAKAGQVAPHVGFRHETEENFQEIHRDLNNKIKDRSMGKKNNKYLVPSYGTQTTLNVVKMWYVTLRYVESTRANSPHCRGSRTFCISLTFLIYVTGTAKQKSGA
jgi:GTPase SAR1 family protein